MLRCLIPPLPHTTVIISVIPAPNRCHRSCQSAINVVLIPSMVCKMQEMICQGEEPGITLPYDLQVSNSTSPPIRVSRCTHLFRCIKPQSLWSLPHWRSSKASWATYSGCPCLGRWVGTDGLQKSLPTSANEWFCDTFTSYILAPMSKKDPNTQKSHKHFFLHDGLIHRALQSPEGSLLSLRLYLCQYKRAPSLMKIL